MFTNKRKSILEAFKKALRVIASCETKIHLDGANNYINNFLMSYSKETDEIIAGRAVLSVDSFAETAYQRLRAQLKSKGKELSV